MNCIGRVLYRQPITVWPATFTTTFTFLITNPVGDGLAFIVVPNNNSFLADSVGGFLGLFNGSTSGYTTNQLAIEFDNYKNNLIDPDDNHVGIDLKSIQSDSTANLDEHGINLKSGRPIRVRIDYDGRKKNLQIYASYADGLTPYASILNQTIDLSNTVPRSAYVGFSAATGTAFQNQHILDWSFSSVSLPESSLNRTSLHESSLNRTSLPESSLNRTRLGRALTFILLVGSIAIGSVLLGLSVWFVRKTLKGRRGAGKISGGLSGELAMIEYRTADSPYAPRRFSYKILLEATKNFSDTELLGKGGFGSVYKGTMEGRDGARALIAVKRISAGSRQGEREFMSEISTIGRLRHRNLVRLHGWCHERDELLLVYDYMPNGSLDRFIFRQQGDRDQQRNQNQPPLDWVRRHKIICGLASALQYLHEEWEQRVVHRDVKPSNIMLDRDFNTLWVTSASLGSLNTTTHLWLSVPSWRGRLAIGRPSAATLAGPLQSRMFSVLVSACWRWPAGGGLRSEIRN